MRVLSFSLGALAASMAVTVADPAGYEWQPAPGDSSRSPCPMLNSVANHGFIDRSGKNISIADLQKGFDAAVHVTANLLVQVATVGLTVSTTGNNATFNLEDLKAHNVIEHDASISRKDAYFGDALHLDPEVWASTLALFTRDSVTIEMAAAAHVQRLAVSNATNPEFTLTSFGAQATVVDSALYQVTLGDINNGGPPLQWVKILFEQERIPFNEGFVRSEAAIDDDAINGMAAKIAAASA